MVRDAVVSMRWEPSNATSTMELPTRHWTGRTRTTSTATLTAHAGKKKMQYKKWGVLLHSTERNNNCR